MSRRAASSRWWRFIVATLLVWAGVGTALVGASGPAYAVGSCGAGASLFAGYHGYSTPPQGLTQTPEGVSAYINIRSGATCSGAGNGNEYSQAWVMIEDQYSQGYAKAGYGYLKGLSCAANFFEYVNSVGGQFNRVRNATYCNNLNDFHAYRVTYTGPPGYNPPCRCYDLYLDAYAIAGHTPFDPWQDGWSFSPQFAGDVNDQGSNIPGSVSNKNSIYALGIQSMSDGQIRTIPCYLKQLPGTSRLHSGATACNNTQVWTDPL